MLRLVPFSSFFMLLLSLTTAVGCGAGAAGPKRYVASGTVTLNGTSLASGRINFVDLKGGGDGGDISGGSFSVPTSLGKKRVEITAQKSSDKPVEGKQGIMQTEALIPRKYNSRSVLTAEIVADKPNNALKFELTATPADKVADEAADKAGNAPKSSYGKK